MQNLPEISTDWNLVLQSNISLLWIDYCLKNSKKTTSKSNKLLLFEFQKKYSDINILNFGTLVMASFMLFVYPKETNLTLDFLNDLNMNEFKIIQFENNKNYKVDNKYIAGRIRNSLSHGRFEVIKDIFIFHDWDPKAKNKNYIKIEIQFLKYADFIYEFVLKSIKNNL